jgi:hypothetical protein
MSITFNPYVAALYVIGAPLGFFVVGGVLAFIRLTIGSKRPAIG